MKFAILGIMLLFATSGLAGATVSTVSDTLSSYWGPVPAPADTLRSVPVPRPTPTWKHLVRVPYYAVAGPLTLVDWTVRGVVTEAERIGLFEPADYLVTGVRDPLGNFWLPTGSIGDDRGLEYGLMVRRAHFPGHNWVSRVSYTTSTRESNVLTGGIRSDFGESTWFELGGGRIREENVEFFGRGWDSREADAVEYRRHVDWIGTSWRLPRRRLVPLGDFATSTAVMYSSVLATEEFDPDDDRSLRLLQDGTPAGFGAWSSGVTAAIGATYDDTDRDGNPNHGQRLAARVQRFWSTDDQDISHWTWTVSYERFMELWLPQRILAVKAWYLRQEATGDDAIPLTRLLNNRDPYKLRGYSSQRFHATGATGLSLEYRWPFWLLNEVGGAGVDAYIFGDAGQFFDETRELQVDRLVYSTGVGLRAIGADGGFALRVELAYGEEGFRARLTANQLFHFVKAGFYNGSDPLPLLR